MIRDSHFRFFMPDPMDAAWQNIRGRRGINLGGSTGARLHETPTGQRFVRKKGAHPAHILNEFDMNRYLDALGVGVPEAKLFGPSQWPYTMLSRYEEDARPLNLHDKDAVQRVRQDFVPHAAIGNWDVLGLGLDNVLIRPDGTPTYVDVGGAGPFRAQGAPKKDAWSGDISDLDTMQWKPSYTPEVFGNMSEQELGQSWDQYGGEDAFTQALQHLQNPMTRNVMQERIGNIARRVA
tara:strand:+ start:2797 stop:3504 length:708 start_codon:yes stop_codon:yes gene_type:complete